MIYRDHTITTTTNPDQTYGIDVTSDTFHLTATFSSTSKSKALANAKAEVDRRIDEVADRRRPTIYAR